MDSSLGYNSRCSTKTRGKLFSSHYVTTPAPILTSSFRKIAIEKRTRHCSLVRVRSYVLLEDRAEAVDETTLLLVGVLVVDHIKLEENIFRV